MKLAPKHAIVLALVWAVAVVAAPVGVIAATGQLVNVVDPVDQTRRARVGTSGTLFVESRPGVPRGAFNVLTEDITNVVGHTVQEASAGARIAITQVTFTLRGDDSTATNHVRLLSQTRESGSAACGGSGWSLPSTLTTVVLRAGETVQLEYPGPTLTAKSKPGQRTCLRLQQTRWTGGTELDVQVTGYTYTG